MTPDVLVVGAGIFGVTAAVEMAERGRSVVLTDPGPIPHPRASSTDVSKAVRMDYGADEFMMDFAEECLAGWDAWSAAWPEPLYHPCGFLVLTREPMEPGSFEYESFVRMEAGGHHPRRLDAAAVTRHYPTWAEGQFVDGYWNPRGGWAQSGRVVARLADHARSLGVEVRENCTVDSLIEERGRIAGAALAGGGKLKAKLVILAAGAWSAHLLPELAGHLRPTAQTVLHFRPDDPGGFSPPEFPVWAADISTTGYYGFPVNADGVVKVANHGEGRRLDPASDPAVPPEDEERFRTFLSKYLPAMAGAPLAASRVCFYCDTWDGDFYITLHPRLEGLVVATGGSGHAFKFAPGLGSLIADVAMGRPNPRAGRFAWRTPGAAKAESARSRS